EILQGHLLVRSRFEPGRPGRDDVAPPRPGRLSRLLAPSPLRRARPRGAGQRRRKVPRRGVSGDDPHLPRVPSVDPDPPADRAVWTPAVRRLEAARGAAHRAPAVQLQVCAGLTPRVRSVKRHEEDAAMPPTSITIDKLTPHIGAEVHGVDLSRPLDE